MEGDLIDSVAILCFACMYTSLALLTAIGSVLYAGVPFRYSSTDKIEMEELNGPPC